jgi:hypothetical protein
VLLENGEVAPVIEGTSGDVRVKAVRWILAAIVLFEAVGVLAYGAFLGVETVVGDPVEPVAAAVMAVFVLLVGIGLVLCSREALRGSRGVRAPILVWAILQGAVGAQALSNRWLLSVVMVVSAALSVVGVLWPGVIKADVAPE